MTDRETLIAMLDRAEVKWTATSSQDIEIEAQTGPNNGGYPGFVATLDFTEQGNLRRVRVWE